MPGRGAWRPARQHASPNDMQPSQHPPRGATVHNKSASTAAQRRWPDLPQRGSIQLGAGGRHRSGALQRRRRQTAEWLGAEVLQGGHLHRKSRRGIGDRGVVREKTPGRKLTTQEAGAALRTGRPSAEGRPTELCCQVAASQGLANAAPARWAPVRSNPDWSCSFHASLQNTAHSHAPQRSAGQRSAAQRTLRPCRMQPVLK
jgi:hypothetical protein